MAFFTAPQVSALAQQVVRVATLVDFDFVGANERLWNGFGDLDTGGFTWKGIASFGAIDGLEEVRGAISQQVTFTLSGVDEDILALAIGDTADVEGRTVTVYLQLFDDDWQVEGDPIPIWWGIMQPPRITANASMRAISVPAENLFYGRARPRAGRYTDRDQQKRFPGDRFFDRVGALVSKPILWPDYN